MSEISGVLSMFFISMAFLTSCGPTGQPKSDAPAPLVMLHE